MPENRLGMGIPHIEMAVVKYQYFLNFQINPHFIDVTEDIPEIKYFFNSGIANEDGGETSKRHVKTTIEEIIAKEDTEHPFSDQEIYRRLQEEKIKIARRTVTKYREELKILPARFRKRKV